MELGLEDERPLPVRARGLGDRRGRSDLPVPVRLVAEQLGEARVGAEVGQAEPVDRSVMTDQCGRVEIADHGVVLDRQGH